MRQRRNLRERGPRHQNQCGSCARGIVFRTKFKTSFANMECQMLCLANNCRWCGERVIEHPCQKANCSKSLALLAAKSSHESTRSRSRWIGFYETTMPARHIHYCTSVGNHWVKGNEPRKDDGSMRHWRQSRSSTIDEQQQANERWRVLIQKSPASDCTLQCKIQFVFESFKFKIVVIAVARFVCLCIWFQWRKQDVAIQFCN